MRELTILFAVGCMFWLSLSQTISAQEASPCGDGSETCNPLERSDLPLTVRPRAGHAPGEGFKSNQCDRAPGVEGPSDTECLSESNPIFAAKPLVWDQDKLVVVMSVANRSLDDTIIVQQISSNPITFTDLYIQQTNGVANLVAGTEDRSVCGPTRRRSSGEAELSFGDGRLVFATLDLSSSNCSAEDLDLIGEGPVSLCIAFKTVGRYDGNAARYALRKLLTGEKYSCATVSASDAESSSFSD